MIYNDLLRKGCWKKINACYWVAGVIDSINANLNVSSPMRSENLDARARCSHICVTSWWVSHVLLSFFPRCEMKMPLTKTKKIHRELRKNTRKRRWTCERRREEDRRRCFTVWNSFLRNTIGKEACLRYLFIYLFIFDQLKFMYLCFLRIFRYSYYHEEAGPISDTSTKITIITTINNRNKNNEDQLWWEVKRSNIPGGRRWRCGKFNRKLRTSKK